MQLQVCLFFKENIRFAKVDKDWREKNNWCLEYNIFGRSTALHLFIISTE